VQVAEVVLALGRRDGAGPPVLRQPVRLGPHQLRWGVTRRERAVKSSAPRCAQRPEPHVGGGPRRVELVLVERDPVDVPTTSRTRWPTRANPGSTVQVRPGAGHRRRVAPGAGAQRGATIFTAAFARVTPHPELVRAEATGWRRTGGPARRGGREPGRPPRPARAPRPRPGRDAPQVRAVAELRSAGEGVGGDQPGTGRGRRHAGDVDSPPQEGGACGVGRRVNRFTVTSQRKGTWAREASGAASARRWEQPHRRAGRRAARRTRSSGSSRIRGPCEGILPTRPGAVVRCPAVTPGRGRPWFSSTTAPKTCPTW